MSLNRDHSHNWHCVTKVLCISSLLAVIACKPKFPSYISALLPQDQIFEPDPDFQFESNTVKKKKDQESEETEESKSVGKNC